MTQNRAQVDGGANNVRQQQSGEIVMSQLKILPLATVGAGTLTAAMVLAGILNRTGPVGAYIDTFPAASDILAANPQLGVGDSWTFVFRNTVAQAMTAAAGVGIILGTNVDTAASLVREYLFTVLSGGVQQIFAANTTNTSATITGLTQSQAALLQPGMGVTGTGIQANSTILGVNSTLGTVTLSLAATATGTVALTFFPRIQLEGISSTTL
jgi:hypothetical protein